MSNNAPVHPTVGTSWRVAILALFGVFHARVAPATAEQIRLAPVDARKRARRSAIWSGVYAYVISALIVRGLSYAVYYPLGQPGWFRWLGIPVAALLIGFAVWVGRQEWRLVLGQSLRG